MISIPSTIPANAKYTYREILNDKHLTDHGLYLVRGPAAVRADCYWYVRLPLYNHAAMTADQKRVAH